MSPTTWTTTHGDTVEVYESTESFWAGPDSGEPVQLYTWFRYRVQARNGEIVEQGSEGYTRLDAAVEAATRHHPRPEDVDAVTQQRDELLALVRAVVDGVEQVKSGDDGTLVETRVPRGTFAALAKAAAR